MFFYKLIILFFHLVELNMHGVFSTLSPKPKDKLSID